MHLFFDLDGTIVDSRRAITRATQDVFLTRFGVEIPSASIIDKMGVPIEISFRTLAGITLSKQDVDIAAAEFRRTYQAIAPDLLTLFDDARDVLEKLVLKGHRLAIVTSKKTSSATGDLKHLGIAHLFKSVVGSDRTTAHKPDQAPLQLARLELGACATEYVIGDADVDIMMADAARISSIGVTWGAHDAYTLRRAGAHRLANNFRELERILDE